MPIYLGRRTIVLPAAPRRHTVVAPVAETFVKLRDEPSLNNGWEAVEEMAATYEGYNRLVKDESLSLERALCADTFDDESPTSNIKYWQTWMNSGWRWTWLQDTDDFWRVETQNVYEVEDAKPVPVRKVKATRDAASEARTGGNDEVPSVGPVVPPQAVPRGQSRVDKLPLRFRRRSRVVGALQARLEQLADMNAPGGETSVQSVSAWFRNIYGGQAKLLAVMLEGPQLGGLQADKKPVGDEGGDAPEPPRDIWATVELEGQARNLQVSLLLLARLVNYQAFRPRNVLTLQTLAVKAREYATQEGMSPVQLSSVLHGTCILAASVTVAEVSGLEALGRGRGAERVLAWSNRLSLGVLREASVNWLFRVAALALPAGVLAGVAGFVGMAYPSVYQWLGAMLSLVPAEAWLAIASSAAFLALVIGVVLLWRASRVSALRWAPV